ncbi:MAG: tRNA (N(6)-L-threonylcarbamoyladenosine(37)-C(2))-methylthiotransferase MtaB [Spirochaetales bacterium]|nr:tRNA (N(6)-L-threonylcarbamoyladenosine(37)-C(2))-methylthiotransferase MtaB [Spirochaetales bacterium]
MTPTVSFRTFGCRLNQTETEAASAAFRAAGFAVLAFDQPANVVVFNTCTVTSKAEQKARRELRLAVRRSPDAVIVATGCYAELDPAALAELAPRVVVLPGSRKGALPTLAADLAAAFAEGLDPLDEARRSVAAAEGASVDPFFFDPGDYRHRSRAALKVQDGCNNRCTYCRVCLARGRSVSLDPALALERARVLEGLGYPEIVLTGVNLSHYRAGGLGFPGLVELLARETDHVAYRVSSWEPDGVDDAFLRAFALPRVRPHLHLATQSGSDAVLRAMGRAYRRADVLRAVSDARAAKGDPFIGMDLIMGFPGEGDDEFVDSVDLIQRTAPAWVHAFTFSPRPGTKAFGMKPRVPERLAVERAARVAELAVRGRADFASRRVGKTLLAVPELADGDRPLARTEHDDEGAALFRARVAANGLSVLVAEPAARSTGPVTVRAVSADYLKLDVRGLPPDARGEFSCRVTGAANGSDADLAAEYRP